VRFTTADGRAVEFTSAVRYSVTPVIGGVVDVRYLPDDPEQAEIDRAFRLLGAMLPSYTLWLPAATSLLIGLGLLVAGAVVYFR
jgi:hypothetical protein